MPPGDQLPLLQTDQSPDRNQFRDLAAPKGQYRLLPAGQPQGLNHQLDPMSPAGQLHLFLTGQPPNLNQYKDQALRKDQLRQPPASQSQGLNQDRGEKALVHQDNQLRAQNRQAREAAGMPKQNLPLKEVIIRGNPDHLSHHAENNKPDLSSQQHIDSAS
jgi:hypothetical protein